MAGIKIIVILCGYFFSAIIFAASTTDPLSDWPAESSPQIVGQAIAQNFLRRPHMLHPENNKIHYAEALTWWGALKFSAQTNNKNLAQELTQKFSPLFGNEQNLIPPANHVDFNVFGVVPLQIYFMTGDMQARNLGLAFADAQWDQSTPDGLSLQTRYWVDDMFMITALQTSAYKATGDLIYLNRAATEMDAYLTKLQQDNGLFFHSSEAHYFWGRGNGWYAAGMAELLSVLPEKNPHRKKIFNAYKKMMAALLKYQGESGLWKQIIDYPNAWEETSSSAMFTYAFVVGIQHQWLDEKTYAPAARKGWIALTHQLTTDAELREICVGTGAKNDLNYYLQRPRAIGDYHGQAPMLWTATALAGESK